LPAVAGLLMERELAVLGSLLTSPARPFLVILAGAKISDKFGVIRSLLGKCDILALGGGMANAFLGARGLELGRSLVERERIPDAAQLLADAADAGVEVILPVDRIIAMDMVAGVSHRTVPVDAIPADMAAFDIGPASVAQIAAAAARAGTVFWNGPVGVYELPEFAGGTLGIARAVAMATKHGAITVAAGGDSLAAVNAAGVADHFTHLSTGGGATLELLEGRPLPGVECLTAK
jgi:phosphoglycerate kinase